jgi:solute carrier family 50 protein (sugar transporter)
MSGNCLGWLAYAYYSGDPFILASNVPGILVSTWLNLGASKLQYHEMMQEQNGVSESDSGHEEEGAASNVKHFLNWTSQDTIWIRILTLWVLILVCVGWTPFLPDHSERKHVIGLLVNINLLFFYAAPLQTVATVIQTKSSDSIHIPTVILNCTNAAFWAAYGIAVNNIVVYGPNGIGLLLGLVQSLLCCCYEKGASIVDVDTRRLLLEEDTVEDNGGDSNDQNGVSEVV